MHRAPPPCRPPRRVAGLRRRLFELERLGLEGFDSNKEDMPWPAPPDPMAKAREAGLVPETAERLEHHVHSHLDVFINGRHILVPGGIGINTKDPRVHSGTILGQPAYGGITVACNQPCISPLHTHDASGIPNPQPMSTTRSGSSSPSGA
jgi:hypothetical protein